MKVAVICVDDSGVEFYRQKWPAQAVAEATGWDIKVYGPRDVKVADEGNSYYLKGVDLKGLDLVVMSRPGKPKMVRFLQEMQRIGVAVVIDVDDDVSACHPKSGSYRVWNGLLRDGTHYDNLRQSCGLADLVTVTTLALERRYGGHGRVERLPNRLPYLPEPTPAKIDGPFTILWSGALASHHGDLEVMGDAIRNMVDRGARLRIVGSMKGVAPILHIPEDAITATGYIPVTEWHETLAREAASADVGIVPLALNTFNAAKSWLKGMEYLGASLPVVASPTEPYRALSKQSPSVRLAATPADWTIALKNVEARSAVAGRSKMHQEVSDEFAASRGLYVLQDGVQGWVDAWQRAVDRRKSLWIPRSPTARVTRSGNAPRRIG